MSQAPARPRRRRGVFYTVGHSTRSIGAFVQLLEEAAVEIVVDIRKLPGSRAQPQFSGERLAAELQRAGIGYAHLPGLGGRRGRRREIPRDLNGHWVKAGFHNYADYALSSEFKDALVALRRIGARSTCAIMCAEAVWWRCHRRIVADYLIAAGHTVLHILARGRIACAELSPGAVVHADGAITYPGSPSPPAGTPDDTARIATRAAAPGRQGARNRNSIVK